MDLAEVANGMTGRFSGKAPLGGTVKFDLGSDGSLFIDGSGRGKHRHRSTRTIPPIAPSP